MFLYLSLHRLPTHPFLLANHLYAGCFEINYFLASIWNYKAYIPRLWCISLSLPINTLKITTDTHEYLSSNLFPHYETPLYCFLHHIHYFLEELWILHCVSLFEELHQLHCVSATLHNLLCRGSLSQECKLCLQNISYQDRHHCHCLLGCIYIIVQNNRTVTCYFL
jgi:hypothetical protein